jgi:hypothetical protein
MAAYRLGAFSYPTMHSCEWGTRYDSIEAAAMALAFVCLLLIPPGLMKSFLTWRGARGCTVQTLAREERLGVCVLSQTEIAVKRPRVCVCTVRDVRRKSLARKQR